MGYSLKLNAIFFTDYHQWAHGFAIVSKHAPRSATNDGAVSLWVASAALAVSIVLPLYLDSRQVPRVHVRVRRYVLASDDWKVYYAVVVINRGRSSVAIN
jgi:hypothetical protein